MANIRIAAVGAKVLYCAEATKGTRPTTGYTALVDVVEAPAAETTLEMQDASSVTEQPRVYVPGHTDHTQNGTLTICHTEEALAAYGTAKTASDTAIAAGKGFWLEYQYPGATKSYFLRVILGEPGTQGVNDTAVNIPCPIGICEIGGWQTKSTSSS